MARPRKLHTIHHNCGCIEQRKPSGGMNWVYCGSWDCPFDPPGTFKKHRPNGYNSYI